MYQELRCFPQVSIQSLPYILSISIPEVAIFRKALDTRSFPRNSAPEDLLQRCVGYNMQAQFSSFLGTPRMLLVALNRLPSSRTSRRNPPGQQSVGNAVS